MIRKHFKQICVFAVMTLTASIAASAQGGPPRRGGNNALEAATEAFGLTEEQMEQIREIRRGRPDRGLNREELQAWRDGQQSKIQDVLTDEQKAKVAELDAAREALRAFPGAVMLGLVDVPNRGRRGFGFNRNQGRGGGPQGWRGRGADRKGGARFGSRGRGGPDRGRRGGRGRGRR
ncbi:MAG: hypothetical protein OXN89_19945 [Bryobacterales bacterium]|nr:hypothetical protein [Bryobacterales bacterium]